MVQKLKFFATGLWVDRHLAQWFTIILIMGNVGLASAIFSGGRQRFSPPSYNPLVDYVDGQVWIWGATILAAAFLMSVPFRWPNIVGLWVSMSWHIVWMACFTRAVFAYETAAATPIPMYFMGASFSLALLTARVVDKSGG